MRQYVNITTIKQSANHKSILNQSKVKVMQKLRKYLVINKNKAI